MVPPRCDIYSARLSPMESLGSGRYSDALSVRVRTGGKETKSTVLLLPLDDGKVRRWCHAYRT